MDIEGQDLLRKFVRERPSCIGAFGYGSKIFSQVGYSKNAKAQYDIIFIVHDMLLWHQENYKENKKDYSYIGRGFLTTDKLEKVKGHTKMTFQSNIKEDRGTFKYGVIEYFDFLRHLKTWESFFIAGRFHKPVLPIQTNPLLDEAIFYNREKGLYTSLLTLGTDSCQLIDLYENLCNLSYDGDLRMDFAENPKKISNIVLGNLELFKQIYGTKNSYFETNEEGLIKTNQGALLEDVESLPLSLLEHLTSCNCNLKNIEEVRKSILMYLNNRNKIESREQILKGIKTNGISRSICYASAKVMKKVKSL